MPLMQANLYNEEEFAYKTAEVDQQTPREMDNINEIRKLIREQSFLNSKSNNNRSHNGCSESSDEVEVPCRRFTPLPDIPRLDDAYYRTESRLITHEIDREKAECLNNTEPFSSNENLDTKQSPIANDYSYFFENDNYYNKNKSSITRSRNNKEAIKINHFSSSVSGKKFVHRLPALEKILNHSLQNTMDLDEDLPINPVNEASQRQIYTSAGERWVNSPIKRPQAPSPQASAYRRKAKQNSDSDTEM